MTLARIAGLAGLIAALLCVSGAAWADGAHATPGASAVYSDELQGYVPGAAVLEGRIRAPCCWNQTIDIHGSEPANELRREIRRRLKAGESIDAIEASIVQRFGKRILAVPHESPLKNVAAALALAMVGAGALGYGMLRRWRRRAAETKQRAAGDKPDNDAQLDARLDAELRALDD